MNAAVTPHDRLLVSLAVAALAAVALTGRARAEPAPMLDRYGGERAGPLQAAPEGKLAAAPMRVATATVAGAGLRGALEPDVRGPQPLQGGLRWSGKTDLGGRLTAAAPQSPPQPAPAAWSPPRAPALALAPQRAAEQRAPSRREAASRMGPQRALPRSIYTPAPTQSAAVEPAPAPTVQQAVAAPRPTPSQAAQDGTQAAAPRMPGPPRFAVQGSSGVRHYSVHREFGMAPDPTPIPPQFFTATADLSSGDVAEANPLPRTPPTQTGAGAGTGKSGRARTVVTANPS